MVFLKIRWFEGAILLLVLLCVAVFFISYYTTNLSGGVIITAERGSAASVPNVEEENSLLDINTATLDELNGLPYISDHVAKRILNYRVELGGFTSIEQLLEVKGVSWELLKEIEPYICVGEGSVTE